jgi:hypothetical protein
LARALGDAPANWSGTTLPVTKLMLVAKRHDGREITFRVLDEIPLARYLRLPGLPA